MSIYKHNFFLLHLIGAINVCAHKDKSEEIAPHFIAQESLSSRDIFSFGEHHL
jgi:hypothetical protein